MGKGVGWKKGGPDRSSSPSLLFKVDGGAGLGGSPRERSSDVEGRAIVLFGVRGRTGEDPGETECGPCVRKLDRQTRETEVWVDENTPPLPSFVLCNKR